MKKSGIKKLITYTVAIALLGTSGMMRLCKEKSNKFTEKTAKYINEFVDDDFIIAAHRGFSSVAIENTSEAFREANEAAFVDYIELDVRLTDDDKLVCVHNDIVIDSTLKKNFVGQLNFEESCDEKFRYFRSNFKNVVGSFFSTTDGSIIRGRSLNLFGIDYSICELEEALEICGNKKILIDLKFDNNFEDFVNFLMENIADVETDKIILQSSDLESLKKLQEIYSEYNYLAVVDEEKDFANCESFQMIGVKKDLIDSSYIDNFVGDGKHLSVWTINTTRDLEKVTESLGDLYDDVIYVTDYPDVLASHLNTIKLEKKKVTTQ